MSRSRPSDYGNGRSGGSRSSSGRYAEERFDDDRYGPGSYGRGEPRRPAGRSGGGGKGAPGGGPGGNGPGGNGPFQFNVGTLAILAGVLVVGIGIGTAISSTTQGDQGNIASSQQLDLAVPDPEFCKQWGASAFVMDIELYTTMNPSSSFVTQPALKPGCVIRRENWSVLQKEGAVTAEQMRQCKQRMNTFAYIGSVKDKPIVRCVYQTDISENKFLTKGVADDTVGITPEADQF
ncbi:DUF3172 domain-containing protein [Cyanobium sp. Alchichica 3B3-8F6]|uniref:DUF3172 domain-containing protein n=1 Tax=Synechococcales TaxID=1890424 RepID=UPI000B998756|nr:MULTISPECIES: DUF3172 domain-containing protein [Synechococcales]MCP9882320.1 DUF3172 domain-containing protein [Cyanobium sp. Alchichica 3B3-8F6]MCP9942414.1 DUF3172 domain-containing protein [Cyanobium sp. ATX 6E8]